MHDQNSSVLAIPHHAPLCNSNMNCEPTFKTVIWPLTPQRALRGEQSQTRRELSQSHDEVTRLRQELEHKDWQLSDKQRVLDREKEITDHYKTIINMADSEEMTGRQELQRVQMVLQESEV